MDGDWAKAEGDDGDDLQLVIVMVGNEIGEYETEREALKRYNEMLTLLQELT